MNQTALRTERKCHMQERFFNQGEVIVREGEISATFFQLVEGTAAVYTNYGETNQQKLTELGAGQYFGEMGVIEWRARSSTVVAETAVRALEISENELNAYFTENPERIMAIMKHLGSRIRSLTKEYDEAVAFRAELKASGKKEEAGFLAKLKKYLGLHEFFKKMEPAPSVEAMRERKAPDGKKKEVLHIEQYSRDTVIFREGESGNCMYAVEGGCVGIYTGYGTDQEQLLTELVPGTFFGEMGMIEQEPRSATAVALEDDTFVEIIRPENLTALFKANPAQVDMILRHLSHRLRQLTDDYKRVCDDVYESWQS